MLVNIPTTGRTGQCVGYTCMECARKREVLDLRFMCSGGCVQMYVCMFACAEVVKVCDTHTLSVCLSVCPLSVN